MQADWPNTQRPTPDTRPDRAVTAAEPASGKTLPEPGKAPPPPQPVDVQAAVRQIQSWLSDAQRSLQFRVDGEAGRPVMLVLNPETGEVIRQIPAEEIVKIAEALDRDGARLINVLA